MKSGRSGAAYQISLRDLEAPPSPCGTVRWLLVDDDLGDSKLLRPYSTHRVLTSNWSLSDRQVKGLESDTSIWSDKAPVHSESLAVAPLLPLSHFPFHSYMGEDSVVQALSGLTPRSISAIVNQPPSFG